MEKVSLLKTEVRGCLGCNAYRYGNPCVQKDSALLMTLADGFFRTFEQAVWYYQFAAVNYIGFHDRDMALAGGCGDANEKPQIDKTGYLQEAYEFEKNIYKE